MHLDMKPKTFIGNMGLDGFFIGKDDLTPPECPILKSKDLSNTIGDNK
jgi:hypothetical protein